jgi:asparagine synthase (glutamine-hydrolysing)
MCSSTGRYVIAFNGEVYNFCDIRRELEEAGACPVLRGRSDTEIVLASIEAWGLEAAVGRFVGMFAFALWDRHERVLRLVRDRVGVKPMYYGWLGNTLLFGSELKALRIHPDFVPAIDRNALALMMRYGYVPSPYSIYKDVFKLTPGSILSVPSERRAALVPRAYWSLEKVAEQGIANRFSGSDEEAVDRLDALLRKSIELRMIADVPLGVFLSGGVDSSTVAAIMQVQSPRPVKSFTIGFNEASYNEANYAKEISRHLNTEHTELIVSPQDAMAVIPMLPSIFDEPFADASQIPTFLVSELARRQVTVSLSGDGGDELFAGYSRHLWGQTVWSRMGRVPMAARKVTSAALNSISPRSWDNLFERTQGIQPVRIRQRNPGDKLVKLADAVLADSPEAMYSVLVSAWKDSEAVVLNGTGTTATLMDRSLAYNSCSITEQMLFLDTVTYLPDDILVKVDRSSMSVGLEAREPLLDHRLVEFAWSLPLNMKLRNGRGKWLLRQVLQKYVPPSMIDRPKAGFGVPLNGWLRGPLRDWAEDLLSEDVLNSQGYLNSKPIRKLWQEHLNGRRNGDARLWNVLMFQSWYASQ